MTNRIESFVLGRSTDKHLRWEISFQLPEDLIPVKLRGKGPYKYGWIFAKERWARETVGFSLEEYKTAFHQIATQFLEWEKVLEHVQELE